MQLAKKMIILAKKAGADYVKFQKRDNKVLLSKKQFNEKHPVEKNSFGNTYGEHREFLEFSFNQHKELYNYCSKKKIKYSCSVWDVNSAKLMKKICKDYIKVPSAVNLNFSLLKYLCINYKKDIHVSTGMTSKKNVKKIVNFFKKYKRNNSLILYSCVSDYPVNISNVNLLDVYELKNKYKKLVKKIGFSGHHNGLSIDNCSVLLGAEWIERHFTFDRTAKGTDHAASLEYEGLYKLKIRIDETLKALTYKTKNILNCEKKQFDYLKKTNILKEVDS